MARFSCVIVVPWICSFGISSQPASADTIDVFPMQLGNSYLYSFEQLSSSWDYGYLEFHRDSGTVRCSIMDSTSTTDTSVTWMLREQWEGIRWIFTSQGVDTMYAFSDSIFLRLLELTAGYHELQCSSSVWRFPVLFLSGISYPVFRYADSTHLTLSFHSSSCFCCVGSNFDSLWFSNDSGLVRRSNDYCVDYDESGSESRSSFNLLSLTIVSVEQPPLLPLPLRLYENYPNPFNPRTTIRFSLPRSGEVSLKIFNLLGEEVATLVSGRVDAGTHAVQWDATGLPSGVYFYRLQAGDFTETRKLVLVK